MKTHKGISFTFSEWLSVAPPETYRYLILREEPRKHISFAPERLLQLIDEFERIEKVYFGLEKALNEVEEDNFKRLYPLCMPDGIPPKPPVRLPYRFAVIFTQLIPLLGKEKVMDKSVSLLKKLYGKREPEDYEASTIEDRLRMAEYWVDHYAPETLKISITDSVPRNVIEKIDEKQKEAFKIILEKLKEREWDEESLQYEIFEVGKKLGIGPKIFGSFYLIFLGKEFGPRLGSFLLSLDKEFVFQRLKEAVE